MEEEDRHRLKEEEAVVSGHWMEVEEEEDHLLKEEAAAVVWKWQQEEEVEEDHHRPMEEEEAVLEMTRSFVENCLRLTVGGAAVVWMQMVREIP